MITRVDVYRLISTIIAENKNKTKAQHKVIFQRVVAKPGYEEYRELAADVLFGLSYRHAHAGVFPTSSIDLERHAEERRREREANDRAVVVAKGLLVGRLLDLVTPNGKTLGKLTGAECVVCGGFFTKVGRSIGANDVVGDVLTEADVREMAEEVYGTSRPKLQPGDSQHRRNV